MAKELDRIITDDELQSVSVEKAAKLLEQSKSEVRKLIRDKEIKAFHSGRSLRIRRIRLLEYIEQKEEEEQW